MLRDGPSELVMINGVLSLCLRQIHQLTCGSVVQREMALPCRFDMGPFGRAELIISMRELDEQSTGSWLDRGWTGRLDFRRRMRRPHNDPTRDEALIASSMALAAAVALGTHQRRAILADLPSEGVDASRALGRAGAQ